MKKNHRIATYLCLFMISMNLIGQEVPLIDRSVFFGNPQIAGGQISPDGKWISFLKEYNGIMNIWVKKFDEPFENAKPLTDSKRPLYGYFWTFDSKFILYVKDKDGDENMNVFAVNPAEANGKTIPNSRNLTPKKDVTAQIYHVSRNNPDLMFIGLNDRDKAWHDLYSLKISTGELKLIYENKERITSYNFDWDDNLRILSKTDEKGTTVFYKINKDKSLQEIYSVNVSESASFLAFNEDNTKAYLETNKGDLDKSALFLMDLNTLKLEKIHSDPKDRVDFGSLILDYNTRKIIAFTYIDDKVQYYWKDEKRKAQFEFVQNKFPGKEISFINSTKNYDKFLISVTGDVIATEVYYYEPATNKLILQYVPRPELKKYEEYLSPMVPIRYKSSDELEIPAYLTLPKNSNGKNLPLVVLVHGGPKGPRDVWGYNPTVQFLANRGYAVLQPNFRASGGYGKKFMNAGDKQWGKLMQDDITWGVKHLIEKGFVDPKRVAIMGGSYGGYATLAGLAFTPELYACGVDIVGPSNLFTLLESIPAYWEAGRAFLYEMVGDPNTEEGKKLLKEASPLFHADKINKPLLIVQGANDPRVKKSESDQIAIALRDKGKRVTYLLADDEGHGFYKPVNQMAMYAEIEKFLAENLGGRYQKDMPEDVAKRLNELRVDVSKLTLKKVENLKPSATLPPIKLNLKPEKQQFESTINIQGQTIKINMQREIVAGKTWQINTTASVMGQESKDNIVLNAQNQPFQRIIQQGPMNITLEYQKNKLVVLSNNQKNELTYEGAFLDLHSSADMMIAGLPLQENYELIFNTFSEENQKIELAKLKVIGSEKIDGKDCWKVELSSLENENKKTLFWIEKNGNSMLKSSRKVAELGGAEMITVRK